MKLKLILEIECGEFTCASEPGKFCKFVCTQRFGTENTCHIFSGWGHKRRIPLDEIEEGEKKGWLARHPECLKHTRS